MAIPNPLIQYANDEPWRARRRTPFAIQTPQMLPRAMADELPCDVCVSPYVQMVSSPCLLQISAEINRTELWPELIYLRLVSGSIQDTCTAVLTPATFTLQWQFSGVYSECPNPGGTGNQWTAQPLVPPDPFAFRCVYDGIATASIPCPGTILPLIVSVHCRGASITTPACASAANNNHLMMRMQLGDSTRYVVLNPEWDGIPANAGNFAMVGPDNDFLNYTLDHKLDTTFTTKIWKYPFAAPVSSGRAVGEITWRLFE
jgi:hypothetical protein